MKFNTLEINKNILEAIEKVNYKEMTDIQEKVIPLVLQNKDVVAIAPTGTGKTASFVIPTLQKIEKDEANQILVLCPTRELVNQTVNEYRNLSTFNKDINVIGVYGGQDIKKQIQLLFKNQPQVIVATPGRLLDLTKRKKINYYGVKTVVLDEADEMFDMGFEEDIKKILQFIKNPHQTVLLSATMDKKTLGISSKFQNDPITVKAQLNNKDIPTIEQYMIEIKEKDKFDLLQALLEKYNFYSAIIFTNTKRKANELENLLKKQYKVNCIHSDLKQNVRERVLRSFRENKIQFIIATDVLARGIDVKKVDAVINYDMPESIDYYIHRIGRTSRNDHVGKAFTFMGKSIYYLKDKLEKRMDSKIIILDPYTFETSATQAPKELKNYGELEFKPRRSRNSNRSQSKTNTRNSRSNFRGGKNDFEKTNSRSYEKQNKSFSSNESFHDKYRNKSWKANSSSGSRNFNKYDKFSDKKNENNFKENKNYKKDFKDSNNKNFNDRSKKQDHSWGNEKKNHSSKNKKYERNFKSSNSHQSNSKFSNNKNGYKNKKSYSSKNKSSTKKS